MPPLVLLLAAAALPPSRLAAQGAAADWKFDVVHLRNKQSFQGLLGEETKDQVKLKHVIRRPGLPTAVVDMDLAREDIERIDRLGDQDRKELAARLDQIDRGGLREKNRVDALALEKAAWPGPGMARRYQGRFFTLESNLREDLVRLIIVRLEDMFQAYTRYIGVRRQPPRPLRILLYRSIPEYQEALRQAGIAMHNPAYYDPARNEIVAGSDLETQAEELDRIRKKHDAMLQELDSQEKKLRKHYGGRPPPAMLGPLREHRTAIQMMNNENESAYRLWQQPLFKMLYHEAFHAYLDDFVYPREQASVPRWLNEGLAQVFESALVDGGELQVGQVDPARRVEVQEALRRDQLVPLSQLLASEPRHFQVSHGGQAWRSDRYFLTSWALAHYLAFDRKVLGTPAMDEYVLSLQQGASPVAAFEKLVGRPLPAFEMDFRQSLRGPRGDGSLKPKP